MRIVNDDIDQIEQRIEKCLKINNNDQNPKVKYILTGTTAKLEIRLDGTPEETNEKIQRISEAIASYFETA